MRIIGLYGRARAGKDTAVQFIAEAAGPRCCVDRAGFADKLKLSFLNALGFDTTDYTREDVLALANVIKETGTITTQWSYESVRLSLEISGRQGQQYYGTEAHRDVFGTDFWIDSLLPLDTDLAPLFPDVDILCVTDVRFPNEAQRILDLGGDVWHIAASGRLGSLTDTHPSEKPLPPEYVTMTVPNNTNIEQFEVAVKTAYAMTTGTVTTC